jgi:GT2 family glycosyltransferase
VSKNRHRNEPVSKTEIDVAVLTAGRFDLLAKCLDSIYREAQLIPLNIHILDNGSDAKERQAHSDLFVYQKEKDPQGNVKDFKVKRLSSNLGFAAGANENARMGKSNLIMFISDDIELLPGAVEKVVRRFDEPNIGVVGMRLMFPLTSTDKNRPAGKTQHCGLAINVRGDIIHPLVGWSASHPKTNISRDVWGVTGACFSIRRSLFNRLGGWDVVYGAGTFEDADLCAKVRQSGNRVFIEAEAQAYHYVGATAEKLQKPFPMQQNKQTFMARWQNSGLVYWTESDFW